MRQAATNQKKEYKSAVGVRGDCLYCPLPLAIDSYWNCLVDCHHCYFRRLNEVWGIDLRPSSPESIYKKLRNGLRNQRPQTSLAHALSLKKTIRVGNKTDPYQPVEMKHTITRRILEHLVKLKWSFAIQTRFVSNMVRDEDVLSQAHKLGLLTLIPIISPGAEQDWEVLERGRTTPIAERLKILKRWVKRGWNIGVNGEPFIPGYHTPLQFRTMLIRLKEARIRSYNTYNFHFNAFVAKRLHAIGIDIERIWVMNQDSKWKRMQQKLCQIAVDENIRLGCPDFVNTGPDWIEKANTCCGVNVPNPSKFNTHWWKRKLQKGQSYKKILSNTWEGIGDRGTAERILIGHPCSFYTMRDAGMI